METRAFLDLEPNPENYIFVRSPVDMTKDQPISAIIAIWGLRKHLRNTELMPKISLAIRFGKPSLFVFMKIVGKMKML